MALRTSLKPTNIHVSAVVEKMPLSLEFHILAFGSILSLIWRDASSHLYGISRKFTKCTETTMRIGINWPENQKSSSFICLTGHGRICFSHEIIAPENMPLTSDMPYIWL